MDVIDLAQKFASFDDTWSPKRIAVANGQDLRLAKVEGAFPWHAHEHEDEVFVVHRGRLLLHLREDGEERTLELGPGQLCVVPRGVDHRPEAPEPTEILLFEPTETCNTGADRNEFTAEVSEI